jgi:hypothetical protein
VERGDAENDTRRAGAWRWTEQDGRRPYIPVQGVHERVKGGRSGRDTQREVYLGAHRVSAPLRCEARMYPDGTDEGVGRALE